MVLRSQPYVLVTSSGWIRRGIVKAITEACGRPARTIADVRSLPTVEFVSERSTIRLGATQVVAVGGGSVIDAAKAIVALSSNARRSSRKPAVLSRRLTGRERLRLSKTVPTLIAVPTTAGTGSEVTPTATVWGTGGEKYSLADPALRPAWAILDPRLCSTMDPVLALSTALDAVSHAMEAVWNSRHTPVSDVAAKSALELLVEALRRRYRIGDVDGAGRRQMGAFYAGLAIASTRTGLAHSISYPLTGRFGVPHGFACSFTLGEVARFNLRGDLERLRVLADCFSCSLRQLPDVINGWLRGLGVGGHILPRLGRCALETLAQEFIDPTRAGNNVRPASADDAVRIVRRSLEAMS